MGGIEGESAHPRIVSLRRISCHCRWGDYKGGESQDHCHKIHLLFTVLSDGRVEQQTAAEDHIGRMINNDVKIKSLNCLIFSTCVYRSSRAKDGGGDRSGVRMGCNGME